MNFLYVCMTACALMVALTDAGTYLNSTLIDKVVVGSKIMYEGTLELNCTRMFIGILTGADYVFIFNVRLPRNTVGMNTLFNGKHGIAVVKPSPFTRGSKFTMEIEVTTDGFKVTVNGKYFAHFPHRTQEYKNADFLKMASIGSISDVKVLFENRYV